MQWLTSVFSPTMLAEGFMVNAFLSGTIVAIVAALVGFFVVLRGSTFVAHALPKVGFAGAAGAVLVGVNPLLGLVVFSLGGAVSIGLLSKNGRHDAVTALTLVVALGTGALFLVLNNSYAAGAYALLFGQVVGVSRSDVIDTGLLGLLCVVALGMLYRPLLFASVTQEVATARGVSVRLLDIAFLLIAGIATAVTVPVVGALLSFSLMVAPAASAAYLTHHPLRMLGVSVALSVLTVWIALTLAYDTGWPIGFFVAALSTLVYAAMRFAARHNRQIATERTHKRPSAPMRRI